MKNKTKKIYKYSVFLMIFVFVMIIPQNVFSAGEPTITIFTEKDEFIIGDEIGVKFQMNTGDISVTSIDLLFTYNNEILEFQDADLSQTGVQISTVSSSFTTITKNIVDPAVGEVKFSGSKIGGISGETILFNAIFKVLKSGSVTIGTDAMMSKIYDTAGVVEYTPGVKVLTLSEVDGGDDPLDDDGGDTELVIGHTPPLKIVPNQDLVMQVQASPEDQVKEARMYFKNSIDTSFTPVKLSPIGSNKFQGDIPKAKVVIGDIQYFFGVIDNANKPHRYPVEDDKFLLVSVKLNDMSTGTIAAPISPAQQNYNTQPTATSYTSTTSTGPEVVYIFIIGVLTMLGFSFFHTSKGQKTL